jgi:GMP synthase-like glutamine amidotransferase
MKIGVLICDHVQDHLQPEFGDYPQMFASFLQKVDAQMEIHNFNVVDGVYPDDIGSCDAYITSGSKSGVNDEQAWIHWLEVFVQQLYSTDIPFIGICFGHQLLARALGGRVEKSTNSWGVGMHTSEVIQHKDWMRPAQSTISLIVSHQDQIVELPTQAEILLSSEFCPYSMIQVGDNMLGIQGHPEFSPAYSRALMESRRDRIPAHLIDQGIETLMQANDANLVMLWLQNFLQQKELKAGDREC